MGLPQLAGKPLPSCSHISPKWDLKRIRKTKAGKWISQDKNSLISKRKPKTNNTNKNSKHPKLKQVTRTQSLINSRLRPTLSDSYSNSYFRNTSQILIARHDMTWHDTTWHDMVWNILSFNSGHLCYHPPSCPPWADLLACQSKREGSNTVKHCSTLAEESQNHMESLMLEKISKIISPTLDQTSPFQLNHNINAKSSCFLNT